jgi:two-component system sensor histidine kinase UhpB
LTNVVRHADADRVDVVIKRQLHNMKPWVVIRVEDNGIGGNAEGEGFGILGMRERVESMGGHFKFDSLPGKGVRVRASMPFIEKQDEK